MQPYQNYYPNQMPVYPNYNQTPVQQNPYMDRLNNLQQFQQSLQPQQQMQQPQQQNILNGKVVDSIDVVRAMDIPMDGSTYFFPKADGTELYAKRWLPNGTTEIIPYKPFLEGNSGEAKDMSQSDKSDGFAMLNSLVDGIMKRFDDLEKRFDELKVPMTNSTAKSSASRTKKEASE